MTELEKMIADAKGCNERLKEINGLSRRKKKEPEKTEPHKGYGEGWRNKPLSDDELSDIKYFRNRGWCVTSIAMFLGISKSTVEKYK